ncbi:MAG: hypothetical protein GX369_06400 [Euryarchaeota archaeon]|mgnify:CR=1 FL=1|nr:hypothetical protein [Euryarchaeota archaeon]
MIALAHLLVALVICKFFNLDRTESFAVLLFGVFIDLDHTFAMIDFIRIQGFSGALDYQAAMASDLEWKSLLHNPVAIAIIGPASAGFRMCLPAFAWGLHLIMDWVQIEYLGVLSMTEIVLMVALVVILISLEKRDLESKGLTHTYLEASISLLHQGGEELVRLFRPFRASQESRDIYP